MFKKHTQEAEILKQTNELLNLTTQIIEDNEVLKHLLRQIILRLDTPERKAEEKVDVPDTVQKKTKTLKDLREEKEFSLQKVANELGCARNAVWVWEVGKAKPTFPNVVKLADLYGCKIEEIESTVKATADEKFSAQLKQSAVLLFRHCAAFEKVNSSHRKK